MQRGAAGVGDVMHEPVGGGGAGYRLDASEPVGDEPGEGAVDLRLVGGPEVGHHGVDVPLRVVPAHGGDVEQPEDDACEDHGSSRHRT